mgnify:CR=1 FL=1
MKKESQPAACVIGLGLIGGSWAGALTELGWSVSAVERNENSLKMALEKGWIQKGWTEDPDFLPVDLVILATPIAVLTETFARIAQRVPAGALITDVGSIKGEICQTALKLSDVFFIGGHPMTGSEKQGFKEANPKLFEGYPYVITPHPQCPREVVDKFTKLLQRVGARVIFRQDLEHDKEVAMVSHLPHVLSLALALAAAEGYGEGKPLELAGRSFRDITRLVDSCPEMWKYILLRNSNAVLSSLDIWEEKLQEIRGFIEDGQGEKLIETFMKAQKVREQVLSRR